MVPPRGSKRRQPKETVGKKVAKTAAGTFASSVLHPDLPKDVINEGTTQAGASLFAHGKKVNIDDSNEDGDDQGTLRDLILRERRSKGRSDHPSAARSLSSSATLTDGRAP